MHKNMAVSSAKSRTLDLTCSGRSFIKARKRMGTSTEPCGTPEETDIVLELMSLVITDCCILSKKSFIHLRMSPLCRKREVFGAVFHVLLYQKHYFNLIILNLSVSLIACFGEFINEHDQLDLAGPPFSEPMLEVIEDVLVRKMF